MSADLSVVKVTSPAAEEHPAAGRTCGRPECGAPGEYVVGKYVACTAHAQELADLITQQLAREENELIHREMRGEFLTPDEITPNGHHVYRSRGTMIPPRVA